MFCFWCDLSIIDGKVGSGYTGPGPDWCTEEGDYGCDNSPETCAEGVGSHATEEHVRQVFKAACELSTLMREGR